MFVKKKKVNLNEILWIDEMYGITKKRLKKIKKKQKENIFRFQKISDETKWDIQGNFVQSQELNELAIYFNSNILGTYWLLEEIKDDDNRLFEHNTDLIFLYIQCLWDYILQYINTYFSLELVESYNEKTNLKYEKKELAIYLEENRGELDKFFINKAEKFIEKDFKLVLKNNVINLLKNKYAISGDLEKLIILLEDKNMELTNYRNKIAHQKSTKSKINKNKDWLNGNEAAIINYNGNVNKDKVLTIIEAELDRLDEALNCLYTIKSNGMYPNSKKNADIIYKIQSIICTNCDTRMYFPILNTLVTTDYLEIIKSCRNCSLQELKIGEIKFSTERGYDFLLQDYMINYNKQFY